MSLAGVFDIVATLGFVIAFGLVLRARADTLDRASKAFLALALGTWVFVGVSNTLEHLADISTLDPYEDFAEILFFPFLIYAIYAMGMREELDRRVDSETAARRSATRILTLHALEHAILSAESASAIAVAGLDHLARLVPCRRGSVVVFDSEGKVGHILAVRVGKETQLGQGATVSLSAFREGAALREGRVNVVTDLRALAERVPLEETLLKEGIVSYICVPLMCGDDIVGVLSLGSDEPDAFSGEAIDIAREVADPLAIAVQQAQQRQAIAEAEARYRRLFEDLSDAAFLAEKDTGTIIDANRRAEALLGLDRSEIVGMNQTDIHPPEEADAYREKFHLYKSQGSPPHDLSEVVRKDGARVPVRISATSLTIDGQDLLLGVFRDMTETRKLEEELAKAQRMESIAVLAGGLAHDFNNILTGIVGNISLARSAADDEEEVREILTDAEQASLRARDLIQQLLTFSKGGAPVRRAVCIADILRETAEFALASSAVHCEFDFHPDLAWVDVDPGQISRAIHNLVINADHAMPDGGVLCVRAENVHVEGGGALPLEDGDYVRITVADEGVGIAAGDIDRIFDPYVTTKEDGSGLGLSSAYSIISKHGGHISVESTEGAGTTFTVYLPAARQGAPATQAETSSPAPDRNGSVLVIDDEEMVLTVCGKLLRHLGYDAALANCSSDAIELYRQALAQGKPFAAAIVDLRIPGDIGGVACAQALRDLHPDARLIVSSGYSSEPVMAEYREHGFDGVVAKPYRVDDLATVLTAVIGTPQS